MSCQVQRADDKAEAVRARLATYDKMTSPLLIHYGTTGQNILTEFKGTESDVIYPLVKDFLHKRAL